MAKGTDKRTSSKDDCLKKLKDHIPTSSTNNELIKLSVVGTSVFDSEKAHAIKLIKQANKNEGIH